MGAWGPFLESPLEHASRFLKPARFRLLGACNPRSQGRMDSRTGAWAMLGAGIAGVLLLGWHKMFKKIDYNKEESKAPCDSEVVFFPDKNLQWSGGDSCGRGMEKVLRTLKLAEKNLDLALFSFSNRRIAREVINCVNRGVKVRLVADSSMIDQLGGQVVGKTLKS